MKTKLSLIAMALWALFLTAACSENQAVADTKDLPVKGLVTMIDLGADQCIPCKMMAPILAELREEYKGKAAIVFLDVRKDRTLVDKYGIRVIPTQIFYDQAGREYLRHEGFMDKKTIVAILTKLGVKS